MKKILFNRSTLLVLLIGATAIAYADTWQLVTDHASLCVGDQLIIACSSKGKTAGNLDTSREVLDTVQSTFSEDAATITSVGTETAVWTLGGTTDKWTLENENGQKLGTMGNRKLCYDSYIMTWTITISDSKATIASTATSYGRFLYNVNAPRFTTYTSNTSNSMLLPQIYRLVQAPKHIFMYEGFAGTTTRCGGGCWYQEGENITLSAGIPTRDGYLFAGWEYNDKIYQPAESFTMPNEDVTLVPTWVVSTNVDITLIPTKSEKIIRNGYLYIVVDGKVYDSMGHEHKY